MTIDDLRDKIRAFARERDWEQFHTPRNLTMALTGEVGELNELFQWVHDNEIEEWLRDPNHLRSLEDELADVLIYLVRLADVVGADLISVAERKLIQNAVRYPIDLVRGQAVKREHPGEEKK
ncbi:nucleotide pyrophosphohydrolase [Naasia sp. SYSU D00057]|uniref:nucleotide pyrophosphohydrolase n=1 Tax=Naasia sp. SYSU D00057 TaxID=2817380 RepID=UPI001B312C5C|nr:nucleotide pyrophosphohydrolase [Naasia sp. SYSU D00057]